MDIHSIPKNLIPPEPERLEVESAVRPQPADARAPAEASAPAAPSADAEPTLSASMVQEKNFRCNLVKQKLSHDLANASAAGHPPEIQVGNAPVRQAGHPLTGPMTEGARLDHLAHGNDWDYRPTPPEE